MWKVNAQNNDAMRKKVKRLSEVKAQEELTKVLIRWKLLIKRKKKSRLRKLLADKVRLLHLLRRWKHTHQYVTKLSELMVSLHLHSIFTVSYTHLTLPTNREV
eukprot:TRINITY_DN25427_c0_g1_i1.p2 TRINITY_DN25427_c0_g1~~TRINITY_DN25427_c0_g1_i1.p2  ORF type:complete len:103 (-),score=14.49 TRINITY_DN25427_c0_g1_i1:34-342(-)